MSARNTFAATRRSHHILKWLKQGEGVTIQRVIDTFGIKYPQAREDLKLLEELYDLVTYRRGRIKVWAWNDFDPEYVSVATAAALELGSVALDLFRDTPYLDEIERLADHCKLRVGQVQAERVDRVAKALHLRRNWLPVHEDRLKAHLESILDAIFHDHGLALQYQRGDGATGHYVVTPGQLVWYHGRLWLLAWHEETTKLFDVAGVLALDVVPQVQSDPAQTLDQDAVDAHFAGAFGIYADNFPPESIRLRVRGAWANYLRRYYLHPSQTNLEVGEELEVRFEMGICPEFRSFLLGMLPDVVVVEPATLQRELAESVQGWLRRSEAAHEPVEGSRDLPGADAAVDPQEEVVG